jgi:hypothetical protein
LIRELAVLIGQYKALATHLCGMVCNSLDLSPEYSWGYDKSRIAEGWDRNLLVGFGLGLALVALPIDFYILAFVTVS